MTPPPAPVLTLTDGERLAAAEALAEAHGTCLSEAEAVELLGFRPARPSPWGPPSRVGASADGSDPARVLEIRRLRGIRFAAEGQRVAEVVLAPVAGLLRCLGLTGSTAYGAPSEGDDLDFLVVVRRGGVWPFLLYAWLAGRFLRPGATDGPRAWCFNFVAEEEAAAQEFRRERGFLVARDALMMRILRGEEFYRTLLSGSPWLGDELPALFEKRARPFGVPTAHRFAAPWPVRCANWVLFPFMATYLQLVALAESARHRASGAPERAFRVVTMPGRLLVRTERFEALDRIWRAAAPARGTLP